MVLGASERPQRYAHMAVRRLVAHGHPVIAIGRRTGAIGDVPIRTDWPAGTAVDTVTLYLNAAHQEEWMQRIMQAGPRRIIFNPGAEHPGLAEKATKAGIEVIEGCTLVMLAAGTY